MSAWSATMSGMQQKEGTNYDGPKPVDTTSSSSLSLASSLASGYAKLSLTAPDGSATTLKMQPIKKQVQVIAPAALAPIAGDDAPLTATHVTTLPDAPNLSIVVLDSGALISSGSVSLHSTSAGFELLTRIYRENDAKTRFVTVQTVLNEIRDEKTRQMLKTLPFEIEVLQVNPDAIREAYRFATLTGDAKTLSTTDIQVIALHYQLEKQHNGLTFLQKEPKTNRVMEALDKQEKEKKNGTTATSAAETAASSSAAPASSASSSSSSAAAPSNSADPSSNASSEEILEQEEVASDDEEEMKADAAEVEAAVAADEAEQAAAAAVAPSTSAPAASTSTSPPSTEAASTSSKAKPTPGFDDDDGDDGEGRWITPANIHAQRPNRSTKPKSLIPESSIAVITTDYAMQNVALQFGLRLLNLRGRSIRSIRTWQKKCHACGALSRDMSREFCAVCGGHTMIRVNVTVNRAGRIRYWHGTRHLNLRGTIYSIPMPRSGRHANNLKFSEDVIDERIRKGYTSSNMKSRHEKTPDQLFDDGVEFGLGRTGPNSNSSQYGYGKKNPNQVQRGGKKKGKGKK